MDQGDQMFKPGWKDIFRMNQTELESEIRKVHRDSTLDPRRKAYLIQNLMTRYASKLYSQIFGKMWVLLFTGITDFYLFVFKYLDVDKLLYGL